jgi:outer membrane protein assembly factor BamD
MLAAGLLLGVGCSSMPDLGDATASDSYETAVAASERGDYMLAIEAFKRVALDSPLHEYADDALIGLADSYRRISDYASAEQEYRTLLRDYPYSPLVPEAEYKLGVCFYEQSPRVQLDQAMTEQAMSQLEYFVATYPESEFVADAEARIGEMRAKLASKSYDAAMLYVSLKRPDAARVYLDSVIADFPETVWARRAMLAKARMLVTGGSREGALEVYRSLIELHPGTEEAAAAGVESAGLGS